MGTRCADHVTPLYPQKLALTSPTGGGRSVGIVRVRTKATEFVYLVHTVAPCYNNLKPLKLSRYLPYHQGYRSKILHGALIALCVVYLRTTSDFCFTQHKQIDFVGMFASYEERLLAS